MLSANEAWYEAIGSVIRGHETSPRKLRIKEIVGAQTIIDMNLPVLSVPERELGYRFMAAEAAWILSGDNRVSTIVPYSKVIKKFSDDGLTYHGAYGPMIRDQLHYICECLHEDPDTRQAVMTIWRPNPRPSADIPCTVSIQFLIRNGSLHVIDNMRSSDLWLGWPYDMFNFSMLARYVILYSGLEHLKLGSLILNAGSLHLYEDNWGKVREIITKPCPPERNIDIPWRGMTPDAFVDSLWEAADDGSISPFSR